MARAAFGRVTLSGRQFMGTHKGTRLGLGKHTGMKAKTAAPAPTPAFETPGMNTAAKIAMPTR